MEHIIYGVVHLRQKQFEFPGIDESLRGGVKGVGGGKNLMAGGRTDMTESLTAVQDLPGIHDVVSG